jgi:AcrR family transcriptional regulator
MTRARPRPLRRRDSYHHGDLRRALTRAALRLIARHGPSGFTLREAARQAGVTHAAPYRHFPNRMALLAAVAEEGFAEMRVSMLAGVDRAGADPAARLQALGVAYVCYAVAHPSHFRVMFGSEIADKCAYPELAAAAAATFQLLVDAIDACQAAGQIPKGPPEDLAVPLWSIVHGLAGLVVDGQVPLATPKGAAVEARAVQATTAIFDGLRFVQREPAM